MNKITKITLNRFKIFSKRCIKNQLMNICKLGPNIKLQIDWINMIVMISKIYVGIPTKIQPKIYIKITFH